MKDRVRSQSCATEEAQPYKGSDKILYGGSGGSPCWERAAGAGISGTWSLVASAENY